MKFKTFQLIIGTDHPTHEDLLKVVEYGPPVFRHRAELFEIEKSFDQDRFFWISCRFDNAEAYSDHVWNSEREEFEENPRTKSQVECRKQLFICFDSCNNLLYMSDMYKRPFLKRYLNHILQKDVAIKNVIHSIEDFQEIVRTLKSATFIQMNNIMNQVPQSIFKQTANIYGLDAPTKLILKVDYGNSPIGVARTAIQNYKQKLDSSEFERVVLIGEDDSGLEHSFDFSSVIQSLDLQLEKDENGHFDSSEVKRLLLNMIR